MNLKNFLVVHLNKEKYLWTAKQFDSVTSDSGKHDGYFSLFFDLEWTEGLLETFVRLINSGLKC